MFKILAMLTCLLALHCVEGHPAEGRPHGHLHVDERISPEALLGHIHVHNVNLDNGHHIVEERDHGDHIHAPDDGELDDEYDDDYEDHIDVIDGHHFSSHGHGHGHGHLDYLEEGHFLGQLSRIIDHDLDFLVKEGEHDFRHSYVHDDYKK